MEKTIWCPTCEAMRFAVHRCKGHENVVVNGKPLVGKKPNVEKNGACPQCAIYRDQLNQRDETIQKLNFALKKISEEKESLIRERDSVVADYKSMKEHPAHLYPFNGQAAPQEAKKASVKPSKAGGGSTTIQGGGLATSEPAVPVKAKFNRGAYQREYARKKAAAEKARKEGLNNG